MATNDERLLQYEEENHRMKRDLAEHREKVKQLTSKLAYAERRVKTAATGARVGAAGRSTRLENAVILKQVQAENDAAILDQRLRDSERQVQREKERVQLFKDKAKEYKTKLNETLRHTKIGVYGSASKPRTVSDSSDFKMKQKILDLEKEVEFLRGQNANEGPRPSSAKKKVRRSLQKSTDTIGAGMLGGDEYCENEDAGLIASPYFNEAGEVLGIQVGDNELQPISIDGVRYLVDYSTSYVYRSPHGRVGPRLIGKLHEGKLKQTSLADVFENRLDEYLKRNKIYLEQLFKDFDSNNDGRLDAIELQALLQEVMPGLSVAHVRFLQSFLDINSDSLSLQEFKMSIQECAALSHNLRTADKVPELHTLLEKLRDYIETNRSTAITAFRELDRDNSGFLENGELLELINRLLPGLSPQQKRLMLGKIHLMDLDGNSKISFKEFVRTLGLIKVVRPSPSSVMSRVINEWILHEFKMESNGKIYWIDKNTKRVYSSKSTSSTFGPVLVGRYMEGDVKILSDDSYSVLGKSLRESTLSDGETVLEKKFNRYCESESVSKLHLTDVSKFLTTVLIDVSVGAANMVQTLCSYQSGTRGSGSTVKEREIITYSRLATVIKEAVFLMSVKAPGTRNAKQNSILETIRKFLSQDRKTLFVTFQKLDHGSGNLPILELAKAISETIPELNEMKFPDTYKALVATLTSLDIDGLGKVSYDEVYNSCGVREVRIVPFSNYRMSEPQRPSSARSPPRSTASSASSSLNNVEVIKLREENLHLRAQLKKLSAVEEELIRTRKEMNATAALNNFADVDRMIIACEQEELPDLKEAWERVGLLQKRYQEAHVALSVMKSNHSRVLSQLEETHKKLNVEMKESRNREAANVELQMQLEAALELRPLLDAAQQEQLRLRKENEQLAATVIDAPADAMSKVNQLNVALAREQRERAAAELREAEARRMAVEATERGSGGSAESTSMLRKERDSARAEVQRLQLDLEQLTEKLKVYSSGAATTSDVARDAFNGTLGLQQDTFDAEEADKPDAEKSVKTLVAELHFSRDQYSVLHSELLKTTKLLRLEEAQSVDLRADIHDTEEAYKQKELVLTKKITSLERELDRRNEKLRKAEAQLRRMFNKNESDSLFSSSLVVRASSSRPPSPGIRDSKTSLLDELREGENVVEFHVESASLNSNAFGESEPSTFLTWDFFEHQTQATSVQTGFSPSYNYTVQYVVKMDPFFIEYLDTKSVQIELNIANGLDFKTVGASTISLNVILDDYTSGSSLSAEGAYHYSDIVGSGGHILGKIRYRSAIKFPFSSVLREYYSLKESSKSAKQNLRRYEVSHALGADPTLSLLASSNVNSCIRITIKGCKGLVKKNVGRGPEMIPYVSYQVPSHPEHDTILGHGPEVELNDIAEFPMARTPPLMERLRTYNMDICVFDDADSDLSEAGVIGIGKVSLENLADCLPIDGNVLIYSLNDNEKCTGSVAIEIRWVELFNGKQSLNSPGHVGEVKRGDSISDVLQPRLLQPSELPTDHPTCPASIEVLGASHGEDLQPSLRRNPNTINIRDSLRRSREVGLLSQDMRMRLGDSVSPAVRDRYVQNLQDSVDFDVSTRSLLDNPDTAIILYIKNVTLLGNVLLEDTRIKNLLVLFELFLNGLGNDQWTQSCTKSRTLKFDYISAFDLSPHTEIGAGNRATILSLAKGDAHSLSTVPFVLVSEGDARGEDGYFEVATNSTLNLKEVLKSGKTSYEDTLEFENEKGEKVALLLVEIKIGKALQELML